MYIFLFVLHFKFRKLFWTLKQIDLTYLIVYLEIKIQELRSKGKFSIVEKQLETLEPNKL